MKDALRAKPSRAIWEYLVILAGTAVYAGAVTVFIRPATPPIPLGGAAGVALLLNSVFNLPTGLMIMALNLPLFLISFRSLGRKFLVRTVTAVVLSSLLIDLIDPFIPKYTGDPLLSSLYGGLFMGLGLGLVFSRGATTGGSDILSKLINARRPHLSLGNLNFGINVVIIAISAIVYHNAESALYAMVLQFVSSAAINAVLGGMDNATAAFIVTQHPQELSSALLTRLGRGVTSIPGTGMYTGDPKCTLLCAVRAHEITALKKLVREVDPNAFLIATGAKEVVGKGFKGYGT